MQAKDLQDSKYQLLLDSQDLDALCDYFPVIPRADITGAIVAVEDGDYSEVWLTESSRPYELAAEYNTIDYFAC